MVNGYHVKGVGRTPLVSVQTSQAHASGGAYLEECVRETIFSELVTTQFPHGAVPTLAIIDTGLVQVRDTDRGPKTERRTLLVRPCFARPAHFQRAAGFQSGHAKEGALDARRVRQVFAAAMDTLGEDGLAGAYEQLWSRWSRQLAYAFVHRMPHGTNSTSNIAFDGRLVDFGAMAAVPSWAATATALEPHHFEHEFGAISGSLRSLAYFFGRHFRQEFASEDAIATRLAHAHAHFRIAVTTQLLRTCGARAAVAHEASVADRSGHLWRLATTVIAHFQRETLDMVETTPEPRIDWDLGRFWDVAPPPHLQPLRAVLNDLVPLSERERARLQNSTLSRTRPPLYPREMRESIYAAVDARPASSEREDMQRVDQLIARYVEESRIDIGE